MYQMQRGTAGKRGNSEKERSGGTARAGAGKRGRKLDVVQTVAAKQRKGNLMERGGQIAGKGGRNTRPGKATDIGEKKKNLPKGIGMNKLGGTGHKGWGLVDTSAEGQGLR